MEGAGVGHSRPGSIAVERAGPLDHGAGGPGRPARRLDRLAGNEAGFGTPAGLSQGICGRQADAPGAAAGLRSRLSRTAPQRAESRRPRAGARLEQLPHNGLLRDVRCDPPATPGDECRRHPAGERLLQRRRGTLCEVHGLVRAAAPVGADPPGVRGRDHARHRHRRYLEDCRRTADLFLHLRWRGLRCAARTRRLGSGRLRRFEMAPSRGHGSAGRRPARAIQSSAARGRDLHARESHAPAARHHGL